MMDREEKMALLAQLLDAVERERGANSNEARAKAADEVLALHHALLDETGVRDLMQRRCVEEMNGRAKGSMSRASELPTDKEFYETKSGGRALRAIAMRSIVDSGILPPAVASLTAAGLYAASQGRVPPTGNEAGKHGGSLWEAEKVKGVDGDSGPEMFLRYKTVIGLGYESGFAGYAETKRLPNHLLYLGVAFWRRYSAALPKGTPRERDYETLRGWCSKANTELHAHFLESFEAGRADRAARRPKSKTMSLSVTPVFS